MLEQTCRTCLATCGELVPIFSDDYYVHNLPDKLLHTIRIEVRSAASQFWPLCSFRYIKCPGFGDLGPISWLAMDSRVDSLWGKVAFGSLGSSRGILLALGLGFGGPCGDECCFVEVVFGCNKWFVGVDGEHSEWMWDGKGSYPVEKSCDCWLAIHLFFRVALVRFIARGLH